MKIVLIILLVLHGAIHLMGFVKAFDILPIKQMNEPISRAFGVIWLLTCLLCLTCVLMMLLNAKGWLVVGITATLISQTLIILSWKDAKFGTVANVIIAAILFML